MFKFNGMTAPVVETFLTQQGLEITRLVFNGPAPYFTASPIVAQVRFTGTDLMFDANTGTMSGTVTSIDIWDKTNSVVLQTMQVTNSAALNGRIEMFLTRAVLYANKIEGWFGGNFDHVDTAQIVYGDTTMSIPVMNSSNVLLGYLKLTGTGLTSDGFSTAIIKTMTHENASHVAVVGDSVSYGTVGVSSNYLDYALLQVTNGINGHMDVIDRILTADGDTFIATGLTGALDGGLGNDTYVLSSYSATISDTGGIDTITSSVTRSLAALTQIENLTLNGTANADGTGNSSANILMGNSGNNTLAGGYGNDTIDGAAGNDTLSGGVGLDKLTGGAGVDSLSGGGDKDILIGGDGNDAMNGGLLRDTMTGGAGADKFVFSLAADTGKTSLTRDLITDFTHSATLALSDRIDLSAIDANWKLAGNNAFIFAGKAALSGKLGEIHYKLYDLVGTANDKTMIEADLTGDKIVDFQIELLGLKALVATDFIL